MKGIRGLGAKQTDANFHGADLFMFPCGPHAGSPERVHTAEVQVSREGSGLGVYLQ